MDTPRCVLCDNPVPEGGKQFTMTPEARAQFERTNPGVDPNASLAKNVLCPACEALPLAERKKLAEKAVERELGAYKTGLVRDMAKKN
jgi:hypothetical protein